MPEQIDFTRDDPPETPKRSRKKAVPPAEAATEDAEPKHAADADAGVAAKTQPTKAAEAADFADVSHLTKKGLRVVSVVTGAVVDQAGNFLFYVDGHEDARSGVQAQINHLLGSGPAREEHLAPARARARELAEKLSLPRSK